MLLYGKIQMSRLMPRLGFRVALLCVARVWQKGKVYILRHAPAEA